MLKLLVQLEVSICATQVAQEEATCNRAFKIDFSVDTTIVLAVLRRCKNP